MNKEYFASPNPDQGRYSAVLLNAPAKNYDSSSRPVGSRELTPYGLASVATYEQNSNPDANVALVDAEFWGLGHQAIIDEIGHATEVGATIGINVITPLFVETMILARELLGKRPDLNIVFGGPHATLDPASILQYLPRAVVVQGDGEGAISEIIANGSPADVDGTVYYENGTIKRGGFGLPRATNVNSSPWLNRNFVKNEPYEKNGLLTVTVLSSRGCRGGCAFCITPAQYEIMRSVMKKVRFRPMENVVAEVAHLRDTLGVQQVQFIDDDIFANPNRVNEFLTYWDQHGLTGNINFLALLRPDLFSKFDQLGQIEKLAKAGLKKLSMGIETGHERGRLMVSGGKSIDPKYKEFNVRTAIQIAAKNSIEVKGFFMIGFPGETAQEIAQTISFMHSLKEDGLSRVALFPVKPYPGTGLWDIAIAQGFTPDELGSYSTPTVADAISRGINPKDLTRDVYATGAQLSDIPPDQLLEICQSEMVRFNGSSG